MHRGRVRGAIVSVAAGALLVGAAGASAQTAELSLSPEAQRIDVGQEFTLAATIRNPTSTPTQPLTAHLEIIDPTRAGSVDAEDWVPDLNTQVGVLEPGASTEVEWKLTPIAGGEFATYVVAIPESAGTTPAEAVVASEAIPVEVREVRTLNPGGALPVSIAVPVVLLVGLVGVRVGAQRGGRRRTRAGE